MSLQVEVYPGRDRGTQRATVFAGREKPRRRRGTQQLAIIMDITFTKITRKQSGPCT